MSSDLLGFLEARLAEDEATARAATPGPWSVDNETYAESISGSDDQDVVAGGRWGGEASVFTSTEDALHIARHDPARVLAEVAAKRAIMDIHSMFIPPYVGVGPDGSCQGCGLGGDGRYYNTPDIKDCPELQALAAIYADHPDWQEGWKS